MATSAPSCVLARGAPYRPGEAGPLSARWLTPGSPRLSRTAELVPVSGSLSTAPSRQRSW
jgi:hypothetical protein